MKIWEVKKKGIWMKLKYNIEFIFYVDYTEFEFDYHSGYDVWAFGFVPDRSWHRLSGIASKASDWDGKTKSD